MIEKAINRILELAKPNVEAINGEQYSDKKLIRIENELRAEPIEFNTLDGFIGYIDKFNSDRKDGAYIVQIASPTEVRLISSLDEDRMREVLAVARAEVVAFPFNSFIYHEKFLINVQSKFDDNKDDRALVLKFAGTVKAGTVTDYSDDGVTQKATIKNGVTSLSEAIIPSPCTLTPFRTFREVEQPTGQFIFRMKEDKYDGIACGLFEADGGEWKLTAKSNIYQYLCKELKDKNVVVLR